MSFSVQRAHGSFLEHLGDFIGETVTIYTTSGGQSGCGFTGVLIIVNPCFIRLITRFGPAPSCALGSSCLGCNNCRSCNLVGGFGGGNFGCGSWVGSVVDIPLDRIASFVHNAV